MSSDEEFDSIDDGMREVVSSIVQKLQDLQNSRADVSEMLVCDSANIQTIPAPETIRTTNAAVAERESYTDQLRRMQGLVGKIKLNSLSLRLCSV